jgi:hypothetical protein
MRRRRAALWAGVYAGLFGVPDDDAEETGSGADAEA